MSTAVSLLPSALFVLVVGSLLLWRTAVGGGRGLVARCFLHFYGADNNNLHNLYNGEKVDLELKPSTKSHQLNISPPNTVDINIAGKMAV